MFSNKAVRINAVDVVLLLRNPGDYAGGSPLTVTVALPGGASTAGALSSAPGLADQPVLHIDTNYILNEADPAMVITAAESSIAGIATELVESRDGHDRLDPAAVDDVLVILNHVVEDL